MPIRFRQVSLSERFHLFVYLFVCILALSRPQSLTDRHQTPCPNWKWSADEVIQFWTQKVKGQGQGRRKGQKHVFGHISASS